MPLDRRILAEKLSRYRNQFKLTQEDVSRATGIPNDRLLAFESEAADPSGDEILILADFYKCDFRFFVSAERLTAIDQTEMLYRRYGDAFDVTDRWAVQECLYMAECEAFLREQLGIRETAFHFTKSGTFYKAHAIDAARSLRTFLGYEDHQVPMDVFADFRGLGLRVFRRRLLNSNISGLYLRHPSAGTCVLVNHSEDIYRQRFSVSHEAGHAILDADQDVVVSFSGWKADDLVEIRANTFASHYLMPPAFLRQVSRVPWTPELALHWASRLKVNPEALAHALLDEELIDRELHASLSQLRISREDKSDPELPPTLSRAARSRREELLIRGLSPQYVSLCFRAYRDGLVSASRVAEMLLVTERDLRSIAELFAEQLTHAT